MNKADLAREYRQKYGAHMPTLKLARILYGENDLLFKNVEDARSRLRYIEGKNGNESQRKYALGKTDAETILTTDRPRNPYNLPASDETTFLPFNISGHKKVGILSDIHCPYHSIEALSLAITDLKKEGIDALLLNGDTIDCHKLSRYVKDPKKRNFKLELDTFKALFEIFEREFKCQIYFKIGNHEERYEHFLQEKAAELKGIEEFEFENIIKARARGIHIIGEKRIMKLNNLTGIHGHEYFGGTSAVNIARSLFTKAKSDSFQGHNHQTSNHVEVDINGNEIKTYSLGTLGELHPEYLPLNRWNHGFGIVHLDSNGKDYEFHNKRIYKGKITY